MRIFIILLVGLLSGCLDQDNSKRVIASDGGVAQTIEGDEASHDPLVETRAGESHDVDESSNVTTVSVVGVTMILTEEEFAAMTKRYTDEELDAMAPKYESE